MTAQLRTELRDRRSGWLLLVLTVTMVTFIAFSLLYVNNRVAASEERDCDTLRADIAAIEQAGQITEAGVNVTQARRVRYLEIGCVPPLPEPHYEIVKTPR